MNVKRKKKGDSNETKEGRRSCNGVRKLSKKMKRRQAQARKKARMSGKDFTSYRLRQPNPEVDKAAEAFGMARAQYVARQSMYQPYGARPESIKPQVVYTSMTEMAKAMTVLLRERREMQRAREVSNFDSRIRRRAKSQKMLRRMFL